MAEKEQKPVSFSFKTGQLSKLVHPSPILHIRLGINPVRAESRDDKFRLYSADGKYDKTLTVKDDKVDGDEFVDLIYDNLKVSQKYTLEINPGAQGKKYNLFEEVPYRELIDFYSELEPGDELEDVEDEEKEDSQKETSEPDWEDEEDGGSEYGGDVDDDDARMEKILEAEEPDEGEEIDWDKVEPGRVFTQSELEDEDDDDEDAERSAMKEWD
ncbi:MAG: hypothetical protein ACOYVF_04250 [Candidatus Zixiibacteriota bacterium]